MLYFSSLPEKIEKIEPHSSSYPFPYYTLPSSSTYVLLAPFSPCSSPWPTSSFLSWIYFLTSSPSSSSLSSLDFNEKKKKKSRRVSYEEALFTQKSGKINVSTSTSSYEEIKIVGECSNKKSLSTMSTISPSCQRYNLSPFLCISPSNQSSTNTNPKTGLREKDAKSNEKINMNNQFHQIVKDDPYANPVKGPRFELLIPLFYAPVLPLIRLALKGRVSQPTIDKIYGATILTALGHAGYIMASDSSV